MGWREGGARLLCTQAMNAHRSAFREFAFVSITRTPNVLEDQGVVNSASLHNSTSNTRGLFGRAPALPKTAPAPASQMERLL